MDDTDLPMPGRRRLALTGLSLGAAALLPGAGRAAEQPSAAAPAPSQSTGPIALHGASPRLTVHVLDTFHGTPAAGLRVDLSAFDGGQHALLRAVTLNPNGRSDEPLLIGDTYRAGRYELLLHVDDYYATRQATLPEPSFLSKVPIRFQVKNTAERIHLPILLGPWSYTYYRGS